MDLQLRVARYAANMGENAGVSTVGNAVPISTPVKLVDEVMRVALSMEVVPIGSPVKCTLSVDLGIDEDSGGVIRSYHPAKVRRFDMGE